MSLSYLLKASRWLAHGLLLSLSWLVSFPSTAAEWRMASVDRPLVHMEGLITPGDARKLENLIAAHNIAPGTHFHLESRGGDVSESLMVGRILRRVSATVTHGYCASSCVLEFAGGTKRYISRKASGRKEGGLVIHQPSATQAILKSNNPVHRMMVSGLRNYLDEMTGGQDFFRVMINVPFDQPKALTIQAAISLGVADEVI